jgi:hypothetical protein
MSEYPITNSEESAEDLDCLRDGIDDRRQDIRLAAVHSWFRKRRTGPRRDNDPQKDIYVDIHEPWLFYVGLGALMLSTLDAFFTLQLLQLGSKEMNPFMDYFIQKDAQLFFVVKFFITAFCIIFLIMHKKFRLFKVVSGYHLLFLCFAAYGLLVAYELSMLMGLPITTWFMI